MYFIQPLFETGSPLRFESQEIALHYCFLFRHVRDFERDTAENDQKGVNHLVF